MANDDAWSAGWAQGSGAAQKRKDKKDKTKTEKPKQFSGSLDPSTLASFHKGGTVKKTGPYRLRKGEKVLTIQQQKSAGLKNTGKKKASYRKRVASKG
jgi:hypothetical protein